MGFGKVFLETVWSGSGIALGVKKSEADIERFSRNSTRLMKSVSDAAKNITSSLTTRVAGLAGGYLAISNLVDFANRGREEFLSLSDAIDTVQLSMANLGKTPMSLEQIEGMSGRVAKYSGAAYTSADITRGAIAQGITGGIDPSMIEEFAQTSADLAALPKFGGDITKAAEQLLDMLHKGTPSDELIKAGVDFTQAQVEQIKALKASGKENEALAEIIKVVSGEFDGLSSKTVNLYTQMENFKDELALHFGEGESKGFAEAMGGVTGDLADGPSEEMKATMENAGKTLGEMKAFGYDLLAGLQHSTNPSDRIDYFGEKGVLSKPLYYVNGGYRLAKEATAGYDDYQAMVGAEDKAELMQGRLNVHQGRVMEFDKSLANADRETLTAAIETAKAEMAKITQQYEVMTGDALTSDRTRNKRGVFEQTDQWVYHEVDGQHFDNKMERMSTLTAMIENYDMYGGAIQRAQESLANLDTQTSPSTPQSAPEPSLLDLAQSSLSDALGNGWESAQKRMASIGNVMGNVIGTVQDNIVDPAKKIMEYNEFQDKSFADLGVHDEKRDYQKYADQALALLESGKLNESDRTLVLDELQKRENSMIEDRSFDGASLATFGSSAAYSAFVGESEQDENRRYREEQKTLLREQNGTLARIEKLLAEPSSNNTDTTEPIPGDIMGVL